MSRWSVLTVAVLATSVPSSAAAQTEPRPARHEYPDVWNGLFVGIGVIGGPGFLANTALDDSLGYGVGAKVSGSVILNVVHLQLSYLHGQFNATLDSDPFELRSDSAIASVGIHPGFLANLYGPVGYIAAAFYLQVGLSAEFVSAHWRDRDLDESWRLGVHWGFGIDVPIDSADDGEAFWVGLNYRFNDVDVDLSQLDAIALESEADLRQHLFLIRLSYRSNGLPF